VIEKVSVTVRNFRVTNTPVTMNGRNNVCVRERKWSIGEIRKWGRPKEGRE